MGVQPSALNPEFALPSTWQDGWSNLTLLPFWSSGHLLVPVSGALRVEVGAYLLIPFLAAAPSAVWIGIIFSAMVNWQLGLTPDQFGLRYTGFLTCFMAFGVGSLVCHYKPRLEKFASPLGSTLAWLAHCTVWLFWGVWPWTWGLYVSLILTAWVLISFVDRKPSAIDKWLGENGPVCTLTKPAGLKSFIDYLATKPASQESGRSLAEKLCNKKVKDLVLEYLKQSITDFTASKSSSFGKDWSPENKSATVKISNEISKSPTVAGMFDKANNVSNCPVKLLNVFEKKSYLESAKALDDIDNLNKKNREAQEKLNKDITKYASDIQKYSDISKTIHFVARDTSGNVILDLSIEPRKEAKK
jgi:hypothetical protein